MSTYKNGETIGSSSKTTPFNLGRVVQLRVERAVQNPLFSVFREEATRQACQVEEGHIKSGTLAPRNLSFTQNTLPYYPFRNHEVADQVLLQDQETLPSRVLLIGGRANQGKFLAEQYLNRGVSVTVFTSDLDAIRDTYLPIADGEREKRQRASQGFVSLTTKDDRVVQQSEALEGATAPLEGMRMERYVVDCKTGVSPQTKPVTLELIEGDYGQFDHIEYATRLASLVYYIASAVQPADQVKGIAARLFTLESERYGVFVRAVESCRKVDAHFVAVVPLWVRRSWLSPSYWYRRLTSTRGFCFAVVHQENTLMRRQGEVSPRCYVGEAEGEEEVPIWKYWATIWRSYTLPEDVVYRRSPMQFTLFRTADIVYPCLNEKLLASKNNDLQHQNVTSAYTGNLDARMISSTIVKTISLCRSVIESRVDLAGDLRKGVNMKDTAAVFDLFSSFRCE